MATLKELQKAFDNKSVNMRTLSGEEYGAIDQLFKTGKLKGYKSADEVLIEQGEAAKDIAKTAETRLRPFAAATQSSVFPKGIRRSDFEMAGDVGASMFVYANDINKTVNTLNLGQGRADFSIEKVGQKSKGFSKLISQLPLMRGVGFLPRVGRLLGKVGDTIWTVGKQAATGKQIYKPSGLMFTEAKAQVAGMGGAGAGSLLYGAAETLTDLPAALSQDLGEVSNQDVDKMNYLQQEVYHAAKAMQWAAYFNAGGIGLIGMLGALGRGTQNVLGLGAPQSKALAKESAEYGFDASVGAAINRNKGMFARFTKDLMGTVGVIPIIGGGARKQRLAQETQWYNRMLKHLDETAPIEQAELLGLNVIGQIHKNFAKMHRIIGTKYDNVMADANAIGLPMIPTKHTNAALNASLADIVDSMPKFMEYVQQDLKGVELGIISDPLVRFYQSLKRHMDGSLMTPANYSSLNQILTDVMKQSAIRDPRRIVGTLREALKKDLNAVAGPEGISNILKTPAVKENYDNLLKGEGKEAADTYLKTLYDDVLAWNKNLSQANKFFHDNVMPYTQSPLSRALKTHDRQFLTNQSLMGVTGPGTINPNMLWNKTLKQVFESNDAFTIKDLKHFLGYDKGGAGTQLFDRMRNLYLFNAFNSSYKKAPTPFAKGGESIFDLLAKADQKGMLNSGKWIDDFNNNMISDDFVKQGFDPEQLAKSGLGTRPYRDLQVPVGEVLEFDSATFLKKLGFSEDMTNNQAVQSKFVEMYGGGKQGEESVKFLQGITRIVNAQQDVKLRDPSQFLTRRIMLSQGRGGSVMGGLVGFGGASTASFLSGSFIPLATFLLLARMSGTYLGNPKNLKLMYDTMTKEAKFLDELGPEGFNALFTSPFRNTVRGRQINKLYAQLFNAAHDENKDFPRVDPNNIDFDAVHKYLLENPTKVPNVKFNKAAIYNNEDRKRAYYEPIRLQTLMNYHPAAVKRATDFYTGALEGKEEIEEANQKDIKKIGGS